jgi:hypothetical protein
MKMFESLNPSLLAPSGNEMYRAPILIGMKSTFLLSISTIRMPVPTHRIEERLCW